jgi:hypothetical protein
VQEGNPGPAPGSSPGSRNLGKHHGIESTLTTINHLSLLFLPLQIFEVVFFIQSLATKTRRRGHNVHLFFDCLPYAPLHKRGGSSASLIAWICTDEFNLKTIAREDGGKVVVGFLEARFAGFHAFLSGVAAAFGEIAAEMIIIDISLNI